MKLGIMQPYFFPYIGYWQLMNYVDEYVVYDDVNFIKGGWINRNRILLNGQPYMINIKMQGASPYKHINEIDIADDSVFVRKQLSTIEMAYKKAPYFDETFEIAQKIYSSTSDKLSDRLFESIKAVCEYLDIDTKLILSSEMDKDDNLKGKDKVISICKELGADTYINAIGGTSLYDKEEFKNNGIRLNFLKPEETEYSQGKYPFVASLSILDVMMFNSKEEIKDKLKHFELV